MIIIQFLISIMWCSICEWLLHRYIMHKSFLGLRYPYERHALTHHIIFKADQSYQLQKEEDKKTIPMAWWNGAVIASLAALPMLLINIKMATITFITALMYYGVYETLHWYMHLPNKRRVEYKDWYKRLNGHHILHHRYTNKNFNVVLPFADLIFGTLIKNSSTSFKQTKPSYCVPDLQPKESQLAKS